MLAERLREQRELLGLSQQALAERCGVTARSQRNYEAGERSPDAAYLTTLAVAGADVLYILTGQRSQPVRADTVLPKEEQAILNSYRLCGTDARKNLLQTAALLAAGVSSQQEDRHKPAQRAVSARNINMTNRAPGGVQVGVAGGSVTVKGHSGRE